MQFLSSKEFDERLPFLCEQIRKRLKLRKIDRVLLWVDNPGKSNLWMSLKCWPHLRDMIDEVWPTSSPLQDPYGGEGYSNGHIFLDDAIFTGEQISTKIHNNSYNLQPSFAFDGTENHLWVVATMAISDAAKVRVSTTVNRGDDRYYLDDDSEESDHELVREIEFVSEVALVPSSLKEKRPSYYTGFKVPDNFSIPLVTLVEKGAIPGLTKENLTKEGEIKVSSIQPSYRSLKLTWKGKAVTLMSLVVG